MLCYVILKGFCLIWLSALSYGVKAGSYLEGGWIYKHIISLIIKKYQFY